MSFLNRWKDQRAIARWEAEGQPAPPPHAVKRRNILRYRDELGLKILVETGTYKGDMVEAMKGEFEQVYSIELADHFYEAAVERFKGDANVEILHGDSGQVVQKLLPRLNQPSLFWLDGHYSAGNTARGDKDTPVMEELEHIFSVPDIRCAILIDDARCFEGDSDQVYPSTDEVRALVAKHRPDWKVEVDDDSIRITPPA